MRVNGFQPALRAREKGQRRHQHQGEAVHQAAKPCADEPHVVIERQPAHENVRGCYFQRLSHGTQAGEQIGMGEYHALGVTGAARSVLKKCHRVRRRRAGLVQQTGLAELRHRDDASQSRHVGCEQARQLLRRPEGNQAYGPGVFQNARMAAKMILDLGQPRGRIYGYRNTAGQ